MNALEGFRNFGKGVLYLILWQRFSKALHSQHGKPYSILSWPSTLIFDGDLDITLLWSIPILWCCNNVLTLLDSVIHRCYSGCLDFKPWPSEVEGRA